MGGVPGLVSRAAHKLSPVKARLATSRQPKTQKNCGILFLNTVTFNKVATVLTRLVLPVATCALCN